MKIVIGLAAAAAAAAGAFFFARKSDNGGRGDGRSGGAGRRKHKQRQHGGGGGSGQPPVLVITADNAPLALPAMPADGDAISVVTYNVLADAFAGKHASYCPAEHLAWEYRWSLLRAALQGWAADVVMLQELTPSMLADVRAWAAGCGYAVAAQNDERGRKPSLCATLYRATRFALWWEDAKRSRAHCCALLYQDSGGVTQALYVANVHLEGHPEKVAERLLQLRGALASTAKHQEAEGLPPEACSLVIGGDFNENVSGHACSGGIYGGDGGGGVRNLLTHGWATLPASSGSQGGGGGGSKPGSVNGGASAVSLAALDAACTAPSEVSQPYLLRDAYAQAPLPYTRCLPRGRATHIDGLFASSHARAAAALHAQQPEVDAWLGMPHAAAPSDHLPLGAVLVFPRAAAAAGG